MAGEWGVGKDVELSGYGLPKVFLSICEKGLRKTKSAFSCCSSNMKTHIFILFVFFCTFCTVWWLSRLDQVKFFCVTHVKHE
jgi:hypothetical protein